MSNLIRILLTIYIVGALVSYVFAVGWETAYWYQHNENKNEEWLKEFGKPMYNAEETREENYRDLGFSFLHSLVVAIIWPIGLPATWCFTGGAKAGWKISLPERS